MVVVVVVVVVVVCDSILQDEIKQTAKFDRVKKKKKM